MSTMNISLTDSLRDFVEKQTERTGYKSNSEYVRSLLLKEQQIEEFREMVLKGIQSPPLEEACDDAYFEKKRDRIKKEAKK